MYQPPAASDPSDATTGFGTGNGVSFDPSNVPVVNQSEQVSEEHGKRSSTDSASDNSNGPSNPDLPQGEARYRHVSELGRGGWGYVVLARDEQLQRDVAVKQISGKLSNRETVHKRFLHEARITGQLQHPGIVPVHELGVAADGAPFYVMKLLEGTTLKETIAELHGQERPLPGGFSVELLERFIDVCNAIAFAHQRNIVHRDLKPANIMVGRFGETIVVDWGLAKEISPQSDEQTIAQSDFARSDFAQPAEIPAEASTPDATLAVGEGSSVMKSRSTTRNRSGKIDSNTRQGTIFGTPAYMSPEQSVGEVDTLTPATDIYALGVILYELLTGDNPFRSADVKTTLSRVQAGKYRPPRAVNKSVPKPLAAICTKAMARRPLDRYSSAEQIVRDIQCFLANEPVSVYEEPYWVKAVRWSKRRPATTAGVLGSVVVLTVSSLVFSAVIHRAHQAEQQARLSAESAKEHALARLADARVAGDAWLIDLSGALQFYPGMDSLRQQLLEQAIEHYGRLADDLAKQNAFDARTQLEHARCQLRLGDLYRLLGNRPTSANHYSEAQAYLSEPMDSELATQHRVESINAEIGLVLLDDNAGNQASPKLFADQVNWLRQELADCDQGLSSHSPLQFANTLSRLQLAVSRRTETDKTEIIERLNEAERWGEFLLQRRGDPRDHQLLQTIRDDLAAAYVTSGQVSNAYRVWSDEIKRLDDLVTRLPHRPDLLQSRAFAIMKLAGTLNQQGKAAEATRQYQLAATDLETAWKLSDADAYYQRNTAASEANLGQLSASVLGNQDSAAAHLVEAIQHLRNAVSVSGPAISDLVHLAECYESLGNLNKRTGKSGTVEYFDLALKCYEVIDEHNAIMPLLNAKWAKLLTNRSQALLVLHRVEEAQDDCELAQRLLTKSHRDPEMESTQHSWIALLQVHLLDLRADLSERDGNAKSASDYRTQARDLLEATATGERNYLANDSFPRAMLTLVDRLIEQTQATPQDYATAAAWLDAMKSVSPSVDETSAWQQRVAIVNWLQGDIDASRQALAKAESIQPDDRLTKALKTAIAPSSQLAAEQELLPQLEALKSDLPGDQRVQFWVDQLSRLTTDRGN